MSLDSLIFTVTFVRHLTSEMKKKYCPKVNRIAAHVNYMPIAWTVVNSLQSSTVR